MWITKVSIQNPVFATMVMVALMVLGLFSYKRLAVDEYPDITYPVITAQTTYPGASPEVVMREVSRPVERALNTVQVGMGFEAGFVIVLLAIILDRISRPAERNTST